MTAEKMFKKFGFDRDENESRILYSKYKHNRFHTGYIFISFEFYPKGVSAYKIMDLINVGYRIKPKVFKAVKKQIKELKKDGRW